MSESTPYKLGKLPSQADRVQFKFASYFSKPDLPKPPKVFGVWQHFWNIHMFQNDRVGDCVLAGGANETASWFHDVGKWVEFTDENVLSDYTAITGYDPVTGNDPGTGMADAAEYRRKTGLVDHKGIRHKVDAYVKLPKGDFETLKMAMYLFGAAGIGILAPDFLMNDFDAGIPWDVKPGSEIGGHYIPGVGIDHDGNIVVVTWGRYQRMTPAFYKKYSDEACGYFSIERTLNRTSPEGFKVDELLTDLKSLKTFFGYEGYNLPLDKPK